MDASLCPFSSINVPGPSAETAIKRCPVRSKTTSFWMGSLILPTALASVCLVGGCGDESHTTGTLASRPPGADEARKKSIETMKSLMKSPPKPGR
jgi:hypothetical protein